MRNFLNCSITAEEYVNRFLRTRREDTCLMSGNYHFDIEKLLNYLFSLVDRHAPFELYEEGDINDEELNDAVNDVYEKLKSF